MVLRFQFGFKQLNISTIMKLEKNSTRVAIATFEVTEIVDFICFNVCDWISHLEPLKYIKHLQVGILELSKQTPFRLQVSF